MAALSAERSISRKGAEATAVVPVITVPLKANAVIYKGGIVAIDRGSGYAVSGSSLAANNVVVVGIALKSVNNTGGSNGALSVDCIRGLFPFANLGADAVAAADVGIAVYVEDDQTIRKTSNTSTRSVAGFFWGFDENSLPLVEIGIRSATGV